jgi:cytochrome c-type biogenesis protein CcmF
LYAILAISILGVIFNSKPRIQSLVAWAQFFLSGFVFVFTLVGLFRGWFCYQYIFHNSERMLSPIYKLSALWSGDAGSLILWLAMISTVILAISRMHDLNRKMLPVAYSLLLMVTVLILLADPFKIVSPLPQDGMGLSVLLRNPWMVSHPPVVFAAYSLMVVPFAMTIGFLLKPGPQNVAPWRKSVLPWLVASWLLLGIGILLGAIWAYETLGWGGYWGWDPVENSSLVPWLLLTVAVHAILIDEGTNQATKAAVGSVLASFLSMLAAVFITRSGALSDLSVHTFAGSSWAFWVIIAGMAASVGWSVYAAIKGWKLLPQNGQSEISSKPFVMGVGNIAMAVFGIAVLCATILPMFGGQSLTRMFYQTVLIPVAVLMLVGSGVSPLLSWKLTTVKQLGKNLIIPLIVAIACIFVVPQNSNWLVILVVFASGLTVAANMMVLTKLPLKKWGSAISHVGLGLLACGILISSIVQDASSATVKLGQSADISGYTIKITDFDQIDSGSKLIAGYSITQSDKETLGFVKGQWDSKAMSWVFQPSFHKTFEKDVMVAISQMRENLVFDMTLAGVVEKEGYRLEVVEFGEDDAKIKLSDGTKNYSVTTPYDMENPKPVTLEENLTILYRGDGTFALRDTRSDREGTLKFSLTVSYKYWMFLLWMGGMILMAGILWSFIQRTRRPQIPAPSGVVKVQAIKA